MTSKGNQRVSTPRLSIPLFIFHRTLFNPHSHGSDASWLLDLIRIKLSESDQLSGFLILVILLLLICQWNSKPGSVLIKAQINLLLIILFPLFINFDGYT